MLCFCGSRLCVPVTSQSSIKTTKYIMLPTLHHSLRNCDIADALSDTVHQKVTHTLGCIAVVQYIDAAYCTDRVAWSVCQSLCVHWLRSWALQKAAESIEIPFEMLIRIGPRNHVSREGSIWMGRVATHCKLECGPMSNVMVALPNIGGALCSTLQRLADAHY